MTGEIPSNPVRGGPTVPPFYYQDILLGLAAAIYAGGGFGIRIVTETAFFVIILQLLLHSKKWLIPAMATIAIACATLPALIQSPFLLTALLLSFKKPGLASLVLLGSALQLWGGYNPFYLPLFLLAPMILVMAPKAKIERAQIPAAVCLLLINLIPTVSPNKIPLAHQRFAFPYRIDAERIAPNAKAGSTYSSIDDQGNHTTAEILVLEHDPAHGLATQNWSQKRLWTQNQYYGSILLRIATSLDGFLYSNLGCKVSNGGIRLLGEAHYGEFNTLVSRSSGKLIFSDSDFLTNGAVGYQRNLTQALFSRFSLAHAILLATTCSCLLAFSSKTQNAAVMLLAVVSISAYAAARTQRIDVRVVDNHAIWPHSKGVGGIASDVSLETGIITVARTGSARILAIGRDASARHNGEKIIVMEGGSRVKINSTWFEAMDYPQGEVDGIIDAIPIRQQSNGGEGKCKLRVGDILLIGTNSARKNSKSIYGASS